MVKSPDNLTTKNEPGADGASNPFVTSKLVPIAQIIGADLSTSKLPPLAKLLNQADAGNSDNLPIAGIRLGRNAGRTEALGRKRLEFADHAFARAMAKLISEESRSKKAPEVEEARDEQVTRPVETVPVGLGVLSYEEPPETFPNLRKNILTAGIALVFLMAAVGIMIGRGFSGDADASAVTENAASENFDRVNESGESPVAPALSESVVPDPKPVADASAVNEKNVKTASSLPKRETVGRRPAVASRRSESDTKPQTVAKQPKPAQVSETSTSKVTRPRIVNVPK